MRLEAVVLESPFLRLEPLDEAHREDLRVACDADPATWTDLYIYSMAGEHFDPTWAKIRAAQADGTNVAFAVMADGRCGGITCFSTLDLPNRWVEIGSTYYGPWLRGGVVNPAAKRLMLAHAFAAGANRVQLRVDALNARSRAAVLKLGAVQEGIIRRERITWTGRVRDTVMFSILSDEWPAVRDRLDARLAAFA